MSAVTLRRYQGDWQVTRGSQRWTPPVLVSRSAFGGWSVTHRGIGLTGYGTLAEVRAWCESGEGTRWLDSRDGAA